MYYNKRHQGTILSPFLFVTVLEALSNEIREELPWELLYIDNLVLMAESLDLLKEKFVKWKDSLEYRGLKVNVSKTSDGE